MSLIHLSSIGDNGGSATRFSNYFPNPIIIEPNSQVALVNCVLNPDGNIIISEGNNLLYFSIGVIGGTTPNPQHELIVPHGDYTPTDLAAELTTQLNALTTQQAYRRLTGATTGGWNVSVVLDTSSGDPRAFKFQSVQNVQPAITGFNKSADWKAIDSTTAANRITRASADIDWDGNGNVSFLRLTKADVAANDDTYQYATSCDHGVYRGLKADGTKPFVLINFDTVDIGGTDGFPEFQYGISQSSFLNNDDGSVKPFSDMLINGEPKYDIGIRVKDNAGTTGAVDKGHLEVLFFNATTGAMTARTLATGGTTFNLNSDKSGHLLRIEWDTQTKVKIYYSNDDDYSATTLLRNETKQYATTLNQLYAALYQKTKKSVVEVAGIFNPDIIPNVHQEQTRRTISLTSGATDDDEDDSDLTAYRTKNIYLSVGKLPNHNTLNKDGTIGNTIGANTALINLAATATSGTADYTTSGRPSFHGNLSTAHIQLPNLPIKAYLGESSNIGKDIAVIPRFDSQASDTGNDSIYYEPGEKIWIDLKNAERLTSNEMTVAIKDSKNRALEGIHEPSSITVIFREKSGYVNKM